MRAAHVGRELSQSQKDHLASLCLSNIGRKHLEITKIKQREAALGRVVSEETRQKLLAASATAFKIKVKYMETSITTVYASARRAGEAIGCSHKLIMARIGKNLRDLIKGRYLI